MAEEQLESREMSEFKQKWIGKEVEVIDPKHPHYRTKGEVTGVDRTAVGFAMKIKDTDNHSIYYGEEFYIFRGNQIKVI